MTLHSTYYILLGFSATCHLFCENSQRPSRSLEQLSIMVTFPNLILNLSKCFTFQGQKSSILFVHVFWINPDSSNLLWILQIRMISMPSSLIHQINFSFIEYRFQIWIWRIMRVLKIQHPKLTRSMTILTTSEGSVNLTITFYRQDLKIRNPV